MNNKGKFKGHPGLRQNIRMSILVAIFLLPAVTIYCRVSGSVNMGSVEAEDRSGPALDAARAFVIAEDFGHAVSAYASLVKKDTANVSLNAEYAYALALNGIYDGALARLDPVVVHGSRRSRQVIYGRGCHAAE